MKKLRIFILAAAAMLMCSSAIAGESVYKQKFDDPRGVFFTEEAFGIKADGKMDVTEALQNALNDLKTERGFGTLYIPEGKYRITKTVYVPGSIRLVGYGAKRPEFILAKNTPGYSEKQNYMFWFTGGIVRDESRISDAGAGTFYSGWSNIDLRIEKGNPMAVALRTHYAQHGVLSHCTINAGDGYACLYDVGNEMENVEFFGGKYGITSGPTSPSWPMACVDIYFEGQKEAAILTRNAGLAIVNMKVKNVPSVAILENAVPDRLYIEDSYFENVKNTAIISTAFDGESNEINLVNVYCKGVPSLASFADGQECKVADKTYKVNELVYGLISKDMGDDADYGLICSTEPAAFPATFSRTVPSTPDMSQWVSVVKYGATGDGETDDTEALQKAFDENDVVFVPEGWYRITKTIKMHKGSKIIGLHPFATQFILAESTPAFSGYGAPVAMVESSEGGDDIFTGIGICTGGYNNRAVGMKWMAGEKSFLNDVKFVGGHGTMRKPTPAPAGAAAPGAGAGRMGGFSMMGASRVSSPSNPIAIQGLDQAWDNQYWSLWVTNGGGGTLKDIWTANTYASTGFYVSNTSTPTRVYAISLEHHVRQESRFYNVQNWKIYAMQYEEESREGHDCVSMALDNCKNIMFANLWFYRVIRVNTPRNYGTWVSNCENIEFRNVKAWTQVMCLTGTMARDINKNIFIGPNELSYARISGNEKSARPAGKIGEPVKIGDNYEFATGATVDSKGNVYFCENRLKKIYKWDAATETLSLIADYPYNPLSLAVDTKDNLIVMCRYTPQPGYLVNGKPEPIVKLKDDNPNYSGWGNSTWNAYAYSIDPQKIDSMTPLELVPTASVKAKRVILPTHRLRSDFDEVSQSLPELSFVATDGVTILPQTYDLGRSIELFAVTPGQKEPVFQIWEDRRNTSQFTVGADGKLTKLGTPIKRGEYGSARDKDGNIYISDGQIIKYDKNGKELQRINIEERPLSIVIGGKNDQYLFVTTNSSFYRIRVK